MEALQAEQKIVSMFGEKLTFIEYFLGKVVQWEETATDLLYSSKKW